MSLPTDGQVVNIMDAHSGIENARRHAVDTSDAGPLSLKQRIVSTVRAAHAERELEKQKAAERVILERQEMELKSKKALLKLLSDDSLNMIIARHTKLGELRTGTIKVSKHGVELFRGTGAGAAHTIGESLDVKFAGSIVQTGKLLKAPEYLARLEELQLQGVAVVTTYDTSSQAVFIKFDYEKALS